MQSFIIVFFLFLASHGTYEMYSNFRNELQMKIKNPIQVGETIIAKNENNTFFLFPTYHELKLSTLQLQSILEFIKTNEIDEVYMECNEDLRNEYWKNITGLLNLLEKSKFSEKMDSQIENYLKENNILTMALDKLDHLKTRPDENRSTRELILDMYKQKEDINKILTQSPYLNAYPILENLDKLNEDIEYFNEILKKTNFISFQDLYQSSFGDLSQMFYTISDVTASKNTQTYLSERNKEWLQKITKTFGKKLIIAGGMHFSESNWSLLRLLKHNHFEIEFDSLFVKTETFNAEKYIDMAQKLDLYLDNAFLNHYTV